MRPTRIDTGDTERLVQLYTDAYNQIINEFLDATDFGQAYRAEILKNIRQILTELGVQTQHWVDNNIPEQYRQGMTDAYTQLEQLGAAISVDASFSTIDREAVKALISDTQASFGDAMSAVNRSAKQIFNDVTKEQIKMRLAQDVVTTNDKQTIVNNIKQRIQEQGVSALEDTSGRSWSLDRYAEMLSRTKIVEARNTGLQNEMLANGYDLVQVSSHGATDVCGDWEGEILSLNGDTPDYPTVDEATADGLFHPNCSHALNTVVPDLASQTNAYNTDTGSYDNQDNTDGL